MVWALSRDGGKGPSRLGIMVRRRFGTAVRRNRAKRLVREFFRLREFHLQPGIDWAVLIREGCRIRTLRDASRSLSVFFNER